MSNNIEGKVVVIRGASSELDAVTHMAIRDQLDGKTGDFVEQVSDDQYPA